MQNDKTEKYNSLVYRILGSISAYASGISGKRLRGYVFAGLLLSGKRFRNQVGCRDGDTSIFAIV